MSLPQIRADWAQHMVYGGWVGASGAATVLMLDAVAGRPGLSPLAPVASLLAALVAGLVKEMWDAQRNRRPGAAIPLQDVSFGDMVATLTGAFPVAIPLFISLWT